VSKTKHRAKRVTYTPALGKAICKLLASGMTLNAVCKRPGMPHERAVRLWAADPEHPFSPNYARAREVGYQRLADELIDICDDSSNDWMERTDPDNPGWNFNGEHVQRARLRIDTRKWLLAKALPKLYGEKVEINARHEHVNGLSDAELERIALGRGEGAAAPSSDPSRLN